MNYYNPYFYTAPSMTGASAPGLIRSLFKGGSINWSSLLSNTQKTIGIINQAIPMVKQVSPMMQNAKTMFKVMNEFKKVEPSSKRQTRTSSNMRTNPVQTEEKTRTQNIEVPAEKTRTIERSSDSGPQFFI